MDCLDRTVKILCNNYPILSKKLYFTPDIAKEIITVTKVPVELNIAEKRADNAHKIQFKNGEIKYLFIEFLFGTDKRELGKYFTKIAIANDLYGHGNAALLVVQITEGDKTTIDPVFNIEVGNIKNAFKMDLLHLNKYIKEIEDGKYYEFAPLLPLLKENADEKLLSHVKKLVDQEPDPKKRGDLYSATVTIASRYREKDFLWNFFKEELRMIQESTIVQDWIDEGIRKGEIKGLREGEIKGLREGEIKGKIEGLEKAVIDVLEIRFEQITNEMIDALKKIRSVGVLDALLKNAIKSESLGEFNDFLKKF